MQKGFINETWNEHQSQSFKCLAFRPFFLSQLLCPFLRLKVYSTFLCVSIRKGSPTFAHFPGLISPPFDGQQTIVRDLERKANNFWQGNVTFYCLFHHSRSGLEGDEWKWSSNFGQSQRNFMPGANKSANLTGKAGKRRAQGRGERESFAMNISSKTRPNSRRALSLASASSLGTSQTKDPQKQSSIIIIRKWKQKCVTNQDFRGSNKNYNYRLTFTNYYVDFPLVKFQWISLTYFLGLKPGSFLQLRAISATPGHTQC